MKKFVALAALLGAAIGQELMNFEEPQVEEVADVSEYADITHHNVGNNQYAPFNYPIFAPREYQANVDKAIAKYPALKSKLQKVRGMGGATWIDSTAAISKIEPILQAINGKATVAMFVLSNMPDKGCNS